MKDMEGGGIHIMQDRNKQDERDQSDRVGKDKQLDQGKQDERSVNITFHISHESMKSMKELMKELNEDMEKRQSEIPRDGKP